MVPVAGILTAPARYAPAKTARAAVNTLRFIEKHRLTN